MVHDGGSESRFLVNAAGCEFAEIIHVCDAEGSIHADANFPRSDECNLVLPGTLKRMLGDLVRRVCLGYVVMSSFGSGTSGN